jgi:hypothetical protein
VPIIVGKTTIQYPSDGGYLAMSQRYPALLPKMEAKFVPPSAHVVEYLLTSRDLERIKSRQNNEDVFLLIVVDRATESRLTSVADWNKFKAQHLPEIFKGIQANSNVPAGTRTADVKRVVAAMPSPDSDLDVYRVTPMSVEFNEHIPSGRDAHVFGGTVKIASAAAWVLVRNKKIDVFAYYPFSPSIEPADVALEKARLRLDAVIDQLVALNPSYSH